MSEPVGLHEICEMLQVSRPTVDAWRHRGVLPDPKWTVGNGPAWERTAIMQWADDTGRLPKQTKAKTRK